jgi:hypothetical protein
MSEIQEELESAQAGAAAIATDLASALFVTIVRIHLERKGCNNGLFGLPEHAHQAGTRSVGACSQLVQGPADSAHVPHRTQARPCPMQIVIPTPCGRGARQWSIPSTLSRMLPSDFIQTPSILHDLQAKPRVLWQPMISM